MRRLALPAGAAPVFMLHQVLPEGEESYDPEMVVSVAAFEALLEWLAEHFEVVPLAELQSRLSRGRRRPLCALTFDDGWLDTYQHAFPRLQRWGMPATVFLPLHFIGTHRRFWQDELQRTLQRLRGCTDATDRLRQAGHGFPWCPSLGAADLNFGRLRRHLVRRASTEAEAFVAQLAATAPPAPQPPERAFMDWEEVAQMQAGGVSFGSHTLEHCLLRCAPPQTAGMELLASRTELSERLGGPVESLSYPWGGLGPLTLGQARAAGYRCAVTTQSGMARADTDPLALPRVALSNAQLGWDQNGANRRWAPQTLLVHLARSRKRVAVPAPPPRSHLRVGFVVDDPAAWAPDSPLMGGSELQLYHILAALDPRYFEPEVYFLKAPAVAEAPQLPWGNFVAASPRGRRWADLLALRGLLQERQPDILQTMFIDGTFTGVPAAWLAGIPKIVWARRNANYWKRWRHHLALPLINRMTNVWQANSRSVASLLREEEGIPESAVEILPNWLDLQRFSPATPEARMAARRQLGLPADAWIVVSVANYRAVKNLPLLLEAAARLAPEMPRAHFLLIGKGPERERLQELIVARSLETRAVLVGESNQVPAYLAAADVGCLTSDSEGCSNAVLEYMAAGLATVISDIAANRELTNEGLFHAGDAASLAGNLRQLAGDPEAAAAMGGRNRRRAEQYGESAFRDRVQAHFVRVAGGVLGRK
ncbi:MAG: glycosyltransferase [Terriglobales bacterium]